MGQVQPLQHDLGGEGKKEKKGEKEDEGEERERTRRYAVVPL
jgi:hypothetical protein